MSYRRKVGFFLFFVGLVLQVGDAEKFPHAVRKQGPCFTAIEEDGGDEKLVQLELLICEADGVALPDPV